MATATFPPDVSVSGSSSSSDVLSRVPLGDMLYEVVDGRIVELPPMGAYESDLQAPRPKAHPHYGDADLNDERLEVAQPVKRSIVRAIS